MKQLREKLTSALTLADPGLIGCRRRNVWSSEDTPWRWIRGNALAAVVGEKEPIYTPAGKLEVFLLHSRWILQFRGGPWNHYWTEDFYDLWALAETYASYDLSETIVVFHENQGELDIKTVPVPAHIDPAERSEEILADYNAEPPGRIPKNQPRAFRVCKHCPVKQRCDAVDKQRGEDDDWSPQYPFP